MEAFGAVIPEMPDGVIRDRYKRRRLPAIPDSEPSGFRDDGAERTTQPDLV